jgi:CheY-like chemotaxis protein
MPKKILLADDSITIQKVVELTFSDGDYEVSAVNNGAKAIQKLAESRPDIILSDIIMPEKNGYEVCEYVKSHPEYRNIPVVLLTGTFEPFDPDRADKAGCDAVVTKPFESQSLIQKVEELIAQASSAPAAPPAAEPVPEPAAFAADTSPWAEAEPEPMATPEPAFPMHDTDIFSAPPQHEPTMETPFDSGAFGGETRAFPRMSFEELQQMAATPEPTPEPPIAMPEPEPEPMMSGGETRAFPRMSFEELQQMTAAPEPGPPAMPEPEPSPFGAMEPAAEERGTHAFPPLSLDESDAAAPFAAPEPPPVVPEPEASPWDQPAAFGGETRAFPKMSFEELQQMAATPEPEPAFEPPPPPPAPEPSPWDEPPIAGGETRAFPSMSFEELQAMASAAPTEEMSPWAEPEPEPVAEPPAAAAEASPFAEPEPEPEPEPLVAAEPEMTAAPAVEEAFPTDVNKMPDEGFPIPINSPAPADLTDEQIDRIARRVVQLMSEQVVRNIAWEVIPDMAEMVVKERIRQLESEA